MVEPTCDFTWRAADGSSHKCPHPVWAGVPMADGQGRVFSGPLAIRLCFTHAWPSLTRRRVARR